MSARRSRLAALAAAAVVTLGATAGGLTATSASLDSGERGVYVPITPCRVMDTRPGTDNVGPRTTPLGTDETHTITVRGTNGNCTIPTDAAGLVLNVAVINPTRASFLTVYPADATRPLAANANWTAGQPPLSNAVTTDISTDGRIAFYNLTGTVDLAADIVGYYTDHTHDDRYPTDAEVTTQISTAIATGVDLPGLGAGTRVEIDTTADTGYASSVAIGADGNPVISYVDGTNDDLRVAACSTPTCLGAITITTIDAGTVNGTGTSIAVPADGLPVIAYEVYGSFDLKVAKCATATCSSSSTVTVDGPGTVGYYPSLAIGTNGFPVVSYSNQGDNDLMVAACSDAACAAATITAVDDSGNGAYETSIAIGSDGRPVIAYHRVTGSDLMVAKCANSACTGAATITTVDAPNSTGAAPSVVIAPNGNPVITYGDDSVSDLRMAVCADPACASATLRTLDSQGSVGTSSAVAIGPDGFPVVAYHDDSQDNLVVLRCGDAACSGGTAIHTVESTGQVGMEVAIALRSGGLPVVAHYDATNGALRLAACSTRGCQP